MTNPIALVGMACVYPDARSPEELWENVLAGRRAFRRLPPERLCADDYWSSDPTALDRSYAIEAAVIEGYEFDRVAFRVAGSSFKAADPAHWLALDVAARALADAGFGQGAGLPRATTGVFLGNTLTGEISRANALRLRWPYVRRMTEAALRDEGWSSERCADFLGRLELRYKAPFPPVGDETLAGGLSNTIAGRICNHFDLKGCGYTVDGACASSLLAVDHACSALAAGDLDVALAGGVDLSLDPFELVGFSKAGALAPETMRVYDARSAGFWPGEGCGLVVLMRLADAQAQGRRVVAVIRGWGLSSDGQGGLTRPEVEGQLLALRRAYQRAGFGIETVTYFEGHGTGTSVGDATELRALGRARREAAADAPPAAIGSIKANVGHTKAAAGVAGLIKAALALEAQIVPPTTGCEQPHPELTGDRPALRVLSQGELWPADHPLRAGISAMGFGGINAHVVLESITDRRRATVNPRERALLSSAQDAELILLGGRDVADLRAKVDQLLTVACRLSWAELADLAGQLPRTLEDRAARAAIVAAQPAELSARLETLRAWLDHRGGDQGEGRGLFDPRRGVFLGLGALQPRIGFVFPGQGSAATLDGAAWRRRFSSVHDLYARSDLPVDGDLRSTAVAQPAIVTASMAALNLLHEFGIEAEIAVGHSLGELSALHWAEAFDGDTLLRIAAARGQAMSDLAGDAGAMASLAADQDEVEALLDGEPVAIAGLNARRQTVVSGPVAAVGAVIARARERGFAAMRLPVAHAFHSPMVAGAVPALAQALAQRPIGRLRRTVVSTVTGARLAADADLRELLLRQVTSPVRFAAAMVEAAAGIDLWIEVGPGRVLSGLVPELIPAPVLSTEAGGPSLIGLLGAVGAAFALGAPVTSVPLFAGRFTRPFQLERQPRFLANPCEEAFRPEPPASRVDDQDRVDQDAVVAQPVPASDRAVSTLEQVRLRVAARAELPPWAVKDDSRLLSDLHLSSIAVGQLVAETARSLDLAPPIEPTAFANATVAQVAEALEDLARTGNGQPAGLLTRFPSGAGPWIRSFTVDLVERPRPRQPAADAAGPWRVIAAPGHPLAEELRQAFDHARAGRGVATCLPPEPDERHVAWLLEGARALFAEQAVDRFMLVQHGGGAASFARTLYLESPQIPTCVVDVPVDHPRAVEWIVAEAEAMFGFTEVHYDQSGCRREPVLRLLSHSQEDRASAPLGPADVLLVTGGGKGIAAECALALARDCGVRLALLGRSRPKTDHDLAGNLERMTASGVVFRYVPADVADPDAVRAAVAEVEAALGPITAVVHGAGVNVPRLLGSLDEAGFLRTLAPKIQGARNILKAVDADRLKLLVTFGSIIARTGLRGEADYAVANEWLARLTEQFQQEHPRCRCLALEWSVWSGVGMGDRLGRIEALASQGITPIPPDQGVSQFRRLVASPQTAVSVVVSGRFGDPPTLAMERNELPLLRFLERPRVDYPGVELVVDAQLATETDPYLDDHVFQGERLFPAVLGLEAMAQAAMAVLRVSVPPVFEDLRFDRPVVTPPGRQTTIRLAALVREPGRVDVVLRCENTAFQLDHFRATCRFDGARHDSTNPLGSVADPGDEALEVPIDPHLDLYGQILFQGGRFQKLRGYRRLRATECVAAIAAGDQAAWFGRYLPGELILGDPATRDAAIHAVQACIPHATILPVGVDRLIPGVSASTGPCFVIAKERFDQGDILIYDLAVSDESGVVRERWEGLRLRVVKRDEPRGSWPVPLLGPYLERRMRALLPWSRLTVEVERNGHVDQNERSDRLLQRAFGRPVPIVRRPDGKPELAGNGNISASATHARDMTLAVAGPDTLTCDVEPAIARSASLWRDLLGPDRWELAQLIMSETGEDVTLAATRAWVAGECLTKAGVDRSVPLVLRGSTSGRDVLLGSDSLAIATFVLPDGNGQDSLVLGLLASHDDAIL
jgi:enediyne polyketide synthase